MYELRIAIRHVFAKKKQTVFSILAVALAVAVITVMMAMLSGVQAQLIESSIENNPHIVVNPKSDADEYIHLYKQLSARIMENKSIIAVSPKFLGQAALKYKNNAEGVSFQGIEPFAENSVMRVNEDVVEGSFFALAHSKYGIVLGDKLAKNLEVKVGDRVDAVYPGSKTTSFRIVGLVHTGTQADESIAYARLDSVQDFFNEKGVVSTIGVRVKDPYQADLLAASIEEKTGLDAVSWIEANADILSLLNTQRIFINIFYILIYGIAGFGIANTLITIVAEKTAEIGILKAMGASKRSITLIFIYQSLILGAFGLVLGSVLGYVSSLLLKSYPVQLPSEMYFGLQTLPMQVEPINFFYAGVFAFLINLLAGVYPARKAAKLDPVTSIESA